MKLIDKIIFFLIVGLPLLSITGCCVIGYEIGALSDSNKIEKLEASFQYAQSIPKNSYIQIILKNGQQYEGLFVSYRKQSVGDECIIWGDMTTKQQNATQISGIDKIVTKQRRNAKWLGLIIGSIFDAIIIAAIFKMNRIFEGLSFFNSPH